jgi:hypothetical protein
MLGIAKEYGLTPESVGVDTLSFRNPANYMFEITGETPEGKKIKGTTRATGALPLKMDVGEAMDAYYKGNPDPFAGFDERMALERSLKDVGRPSREAIEKQRMMEALGMSEKEYDDFQAMKARLGKRNYNTGGPINQYQEGGEVPSFASKKDFRKFLDKQFAQMSASPEDFDSSDKYSMALYSTPEDSARAVLMDVASDKFWKDNYNRLLAKTKYTPERKSIFGTYSPNKDEIETANKQYFLNKKYGDKLEDALNIYSTKQYQQGGQTSLNGITELLSEVGSRGVLGQMQPRKQQEIRNPEVYGPPVPAGIDSVLQQLMMRDVNQSINPFSGDTLDFEGDSLRLLERMKKSHMPTYGRKKMQQGGPVGGQLGEGQPLERRSSPSEQLAQLQGMEARPQNSLMGAAGQDGRIQAIPPDKYIIKDGTMSTREMEIPKLSPAYLQSFGLETPLSKRQNDLLRHRALSPETIGINPQVQSLFGKALIQRLANEPL